MHSLMPPGTTRSARPGWVWALVPLLAFATCLAAPAARPAPLRVTSVRFWSLGDTTRVAIQTNGEFRYKLDRLPNPDRLFFDLLGVKPAAGNGPMRTIAVGDGIVKQIRVAETQPGTTRVVLDLDAGVEYKASQLSSPERLVVELRRLGLAPSAGPSTTHVEQLAEPVAPPAAAPPVTAPIPRKIVPRPFEPPPLRPRPVYAPPPLPAPPVLVATTMLSRYPGPESLATTVVPTHHAAPVQVAASRPKTPSPPVASAPAEPAKQNRGGGRSLTRALGLKVGRIVLDPGHGGHDTGTIGPGGVLEKDLVLDIALRLGPLIEKGMGSEVIYTRNDDTFVPLEERTRIANECQADLFLSIHVNSSPLRSASGSETYYLNFTTSRTALEVAARENATSSKSIHELQDLIRKIALRDKVEESREFAARLQNSLYALAAKNGASKNRGVKKAPFVVLIGAAMPSVLAEVGFVTNPREGMLLKKSDHRQKFAEALYRGLSSYASTLSHFQEARRSGE